MSLKQQFELMARYNRWMNDKLYLVAAQVSQEELGKDRGAYFGSIGGTFNHIMVGDLIWLRRFSTHPRGFSSLQAVASKPAPKSLSEELYHDFTALRMAREQLDMVIEEFAAEAQEDDYAATLNYRNTSGVVFSRNFGMLVQHFYNHQTHHRGQLTTLFNQMGSDPGVTDLLMLIDDEASDKLAR